MRFGFNLYRRTHLAAGPKGWQSILRLILLLCLLASIPGYAPTVRAEAPYQSSKVQAVLASMTPEERTER